VIYKRRSTREGKVTVTFEVPGTIWTESIHLVGDFNNWDTDNLVFQRNWKGDWTIEQELDAGRRYRFRYLFDGNHWGNDWHADGHIDNPDGCDDSIVVADVHSENHRRGMLVPAMNSAAPGSAHAHHRL
jgi:1,4-alpha-glucan branching enzyme